MILKNKSIENNGIQIDGSSYSFNIYENSKKNPNGKKISKILEDLKKELIEKCANDTILIIELLFEKQNLSNKDCFELLTDNKVSNILSDGNIVHNAFEKLLKEINKKEANDLKIKENETITPQISSNSQSNQSNIIMENSVRNRSSNIDTDPNSITKIPDFKGDQFTPSEIDISPNKNSGEKPKDRKYSILIYEKVIGSHFEYRRNNTVEFLKELKETGQYLSVGSDKKILKIYSRQYYDELKDVEIPEVRDCIYDIYEKKTKKS